MKKIITTIFFFSFFIFNFTSAATPEVVVFTAPDWCSYCAKMHPTIEALQAEGYPINFLFFNDNTSKKKAEALGNQPLLQKMEITAFPTIVIINKDGVETRLMGLQSRQEVERAFAEAGIVKNPPVIQPPKPTPVNNVQNPPTPINPQRPPSIPAHPLLPNQVELTCTLNAAETEYVCTGPGVPPLKPIIKGGVGVSGRNMFNDIKNGAIVRYNKSDSSFFFIPRQKPCDPPNPSGLANTLPPLPPVVTPPVTTKKYSSEFIRIESLETDPNSFVLYVNQCEVDDKGGRSNCVKVSFAIAARYYIPAGAEARGRIAAANALGVPISSTAPAVLTPIVPAPMSSPRGEIKYTADTPVKNADGSYSVTVTSCIGLLCSPDKITRIIKNPKVKNPKTATEFERMTAAQSEAIDQVNNEKQKDNKPSIKPASKPDSFAEPSAEDLKKAELQRKIEGVRMRNEAMEKRLKALENNK